MRLLTKHRDGLTNWMHFQVASSVMRLLTKHRRTHILDAFSGRLVSHAPSDETQRRTHSLDAFSGHLVSHAPSDETQRRTHSLDAFSGRLVSYPSRQEEIPMYLLHTPMYSAPAFDITLFPTVLPWK